MEFVYDIYIDVCKGLHKRFPFRKITPLGTICLPNIRYRNPLQIGDTAVLDFEMDGRDRFFLGEIVGINQFGRAGQDEGEKRSIAFIKYSSSLGDSFTESDFRMFRKLQSKLYEK